METASIEATTDDSDDLFMQLRGLTNDKNLTDETCKFYLEMCEGDVEAAAAFYKESMPAPAPAPSVTRTSSSSFSNRSLNHGSCHSGGTAGARRRTSAIAPIAECAVEPFNCVGTLEPGVALAGLRAGRGFAPNLHLLGNAAEFEYFNDSRRRTPMNDSSLNNSLNIQSDVFFYSTPGAFNEYEDGADFIAIERREAPILNRSAPEGLNYPVVQGRQQATERVPRVPRTTRGANTSPKRTSSSPTPCSALARRERPARSKTEHPNRSRSPRKNRDSATTTNTGTYTATTRTMSSSLNLCDYDHNDDYDHDVRMVLSSQSHQQRRGDSLEHPVKSPISRYEAPLRDSWTGKNLYAGKASTNSTTALISRGSTTSTLSAYTEIGNLSDSTMTGHGSSEHFEFHEDDYDEGDRAYHDDRDLDNEDIIGQSENSNQLSKSSGCGADSRRLSPTFHNKGGSATMKDSSQSSSQARPYKPDPPGHSVKTPWLYDDSSRRSPLPEGVDHVERTEIPVTRPPQSQHSRQRGRARLAVGTFPDDVHNAGRAMSEPGSSGIHVESRPQHTSTNSNGNTELDSKLGHVGVGVTDGDHSDEKLIKSSVTQLRTDSEVDHSVVPAEGSDPSDHTKAISPKEGGKGVRRAPATVPGAVHVVAIEPTGPSTTSNNSQESDAVVQRSHGTNPGEFSVVGGEGSEPSEHTKALAAKEGGKGVRLAPATVPGAVNVVAIEPVGPSTTSSSQESGEKEDQHLQVQQPILPSSGKVRNHQPATQPGAQRVQGGKNGLKQKDQKAAAGEPATQPGAVRVSGDDNAGCHKKDGKTAGLRKGSKPGVVNDESQKKEVEKSSGLSSGIGNVEPGAVSVNGVANDVSQKKVMEKSSGLGLGNSNVQPGAVSVTGVSSQDHAKSGKKSKRRHKPVPETIRVDDLSPKSKEESLRGSTNSPDGSRETPSRPGALSVTSSEDSFKVVNSYKGGSSDDNCSLASSKGEQGSDGQDIDVKIDYAQCDDPTLDHTTDYESEGAALNFNLSKTEQPLPRPHGVIVGPSNQIAHSDPGHPLPTIPVPTRRNRNDSATSTESSKKDKRGGIFGLFKRKSKDKQTMVADIIRFEEDDIILSREGNSRPFSPMPTKRN